jgi:NTP pyrophosphatase (non-canonical NTP hydrolase)/deoxyadenosine/deoxycytidine kinase
MRSQHDGTWQEWQQTFDRSRGFDHRLFSDGAVAADGQSAESTLRLIEFCALALAGEVGELANLVKKARRSAWLAEDPSAYIQRAGDELGDVLAYLLKLASTLELDLDVAYLTTLCENFFRFPPQLTESAGRVITICGPMGSGKTATVELLADRFECYIERSSENPQMASWLDHTPDFDAYEHQAWLLEAIRNRTLASSPRTDLVIDQDPAVIGLVYARGLRDSAYLDGESFGAVLLKLAKLELELSAWSAGRLVVCLDASVDVLNQRLVRRDGKAPTREWLYRMREGCQRLVARSPRALTIETESLAPRAVADRIGEWIAQF